ncbi:MAG: hypothetical protein M5U12_37815 [Verrucomicrobia bacterium]|nr:hypothetical protein [Verrucomicrobiota bacterium]
MEPERSGRGQHYGSLLEPTTLGGGGGHASGGQGTAGGGVVRLVVDGNLAVNGRLSADSAGSPPDNAGGGAGGSIWLTVGTLSGNGVISANGGPGEWVDGGGAAAGASPSITRPTRTPEPSRPRAAAATKGAAPARSTPRKPPETRGHLLVDNGGTWGNYTPLQTPQPLRATLAGRAYLYPEGALTFAELELPGEAVLTHLTGQSNVHLHVAGNLRIGASSAISVEGRGYPIGDEQGPGAGTRADWSGSGASHGGLGGWSRTSAGPTAQYGSMLEPTLLGSQGGSANGGPGTAGGGAIRLIVDGTLTVDGSLNANGASAPPDNAGGGAGGSIWLTVGTLSGNGAISANGGPGEWVDGGGGGGGRIAVYYGRSEFTGAITAYGGGGNQRGGAGTVYRREQGAAYGQLLVHNGGAWGNYTPLTSPEPFQLILAEMAYVYPVEPLTVRDLEVRANATLTHLTGQDRCDVTVLNNATVAEGGHVSTDGRGYPLGADLGPGAGVQRDCCGSGGAHGGTGGRSGSGADGGTPYGSLTEPLERGSAGGAGTGGPGGAGGGVVRLRVGNTPDPRRSRHRQRAQRRSGQRRWWRRRQHLSDGENPGWQGGHPGRRRCRGMGGWRRRRRRPHRPPHQHSLLHGELFARGGGGHQRGGAGSIYRLTLGQPGGELVLDNGGNAGALTPLEVPAQTRLILRGGSSFYPAGTLKVVSLELEPGASLTHLTGQPALTVHVDQDLRVAAGAALVADGKGYPLGNDPGPGAGVNGPVCGGGGAHGGTAASPGPGMCSVDKLTAPCSNPRPSARVAAEAVRRPPANEARAEAPCAWSSVASSPWTAP